MEAKPMQNSDEGRLHHGRKMRDPMFETDAEHPTHKTEGDKRH
jgi:hypothetical protein